MINGIASKDEINPHLIYNFRQSDELVKHLKIWDYGVPLPPTLQEDADEKRTVIAMNDELVALYNKAVAFFIVSKEGRKLLKAARTAVGSKTFVPLAYRLDIVTATMSEDAPNANKFGGLPSPLLTSNGKYSISNCWPICPNCHKRMQFVGQINTTYHKWLIHQITSQKNEEHSYHCSGLGFENTNSGIPNTKNLTQYFYCDCNEWESPNSDARAIEQYMFRENDNNEAIERIREFATQENLLNRSISQQAITDLKIGLDLDAPEDGWNGLQLWDVDDFRDAFNEEFNGHTDLM